MIRLNSCLRCKQGTLYRDEDDTRHCVNCGFVQYQPSTPYFDAGARVSSDRANIEAHLPAASSVGT